MLLRVTLPLPGTSLPDTEFHREKCRTGDKERGREEGRERQKKGGREGERGIEREREYNSILATGFSCIHLTLSVAVD